MKSAFRFFAHDRVMRLGMRIFFSVDSLEDEPFIDYDYFRFFRSTKTLYSRLVGVEPYVVCVYKGWGTG